MEPMSEFVREEVVDYTKIMDLLLPLSPENRIKVWDEIQKLQTRIHQLESQVEILTRAAEGK